jgi:stearoyl-CoA desaturase (delta-9 desaturase)
VANEDTALSLDPGAAPLLRKAVPDIDEAPMSTAQQALVGLFVFVPMLALIAAIPFAWGWGLNWHDIVIGAVFYWVSGLGVTVGYHRYFTHSSFKAKSGLRVALAVAGSLALEGPVVTWVADHRRHHKYSDKEGDPHSPWRYGDDAKALAKGLMWAHIMWLFDPNQTSQEKFAPDLLADKKIRIVDNLFPVLVAVTLIGPGTVTASAACWNSVASVAVSHAVCQTTAHEPSGPS